MGVQLDVAHLLRPGEGETISDRAERNVRLICEHELVDVTWTRYEPGERGPDPHVHHRHSDAWYVLEGEVWFGVGPDAAHEIVAPAGTLVLVPPDVVHTFANESSSTAYFLNIHAPSCNFAAHLRGDDTAFDGDDPPEVGGRPAGGVVVTEPVR